MRAFVLTMLFGVFAFCGEAVAIGRVEGARTSSRVMYEDGSAVWVDCEGMDACSLRVMYAGLDLSFTRSELGLDSELLPGEISLVKDDKGSDAEVVVEVACPEYAENPPVYVCVAFISLEDEAVEKVVYARRYIREEYFRTIEALGEADGGG